MALMRETGISFATVTHVRESRMPVSAVRAVRGAIQLDVDEREHVLSSTRELISSVLAANSLVDDDVISILFTATPDVHSEFPAVAARDLGFGDVPLMCTQELDVAGAMPLVIRLMAHVNTTLSRGQVTHVYLRGAAALRRDLAQ
ncbi:MAG: chorismate mutase [Actinomycetota bacterium]|jgi:chorismate mutase|nr:chorismate mutase [Actinomycetota bacterium]